MDISMKIEISLWDRGIIATYAIGYQRKYTIIQVVFTLFGIA
jgi:hypothetical protein